MRSGSPSRYSAPTASISARRSGLRGDDAGASPRSRRISGERETALTTTNDEGAHQRSPAVIGVAGVMQS